jgi:hypothetical protein
VVKVLKEGGLVIYQRIPFTVWVVILPIQSFGTHCKREVKLDKANFPLFAMI